MKRCVNENSLFVYCEISPWIGPKKRNKFFEFRISIWRWFSFDCCFWFVKITLYLKWLYCTLQHWVIIKIKNFCCNFIKVTKIFLIHHRNSILFKWSSTSGNTIKQPAPYMGSTNIFVENNIDKVESFKKKNYFR